MLDLFLIVKANNSVILQSSVVLSGFQDVWFAGETVAFQDTNSGQKKFAFNCNSGSYTPSVERVQMTEQYLNNLFPSIPFIGFNNDDFADFLQSFK